MGKYCKAYYAKRFFDFEGWSINAEELRQPDDGPERTELHDEDILYLQENYVVTDGIFKNENVLFDRVTERWKQFCTEVLEFRAPESETNPPEQPDA